MPLNPLQWLPWSCPCRSPKTLAPGQNWVWMACIPLPLLPRKERKRPRWLREVIGTRWRFLFLQRPTALPATRAALRNLQALAALRAVLQVPELAVGWHGGELAACRVRQEQRAAARVRGLGEHPLGSRLGRYGHRLPMRLLCRHGLHGFHLFLGCVQDLA